MAIRQPGMFLSQPPMATTPSKSSQPITVSIESAMTSRETSEYFMPCVPMEMPSEMVMVLKMSGLLPALVTPSAAAMASWSMWALQGVTWLQVEATPICDLAKSPRSNPTAWSMARLGARSGASTSGPDQWRWSDLRDLAAFLFDDFMSRSLYEIKLPGKSQITPPSASRNRRAE